VGEDEALQRLQDVLAAAEFRPRPAVDFWQWLRQMVADAVYNLAVGMWQSVADAAGGRAGLLGVAGLLVTGALLVVGTVALVLAVRGVIVPHGPSAALDEEERRRRSDALWRQALSLADAGDFGDASRVAYLSALYALDEHALLRLQVGMTNREHARRLEQEHPAPGAPFAQLVQLYDALRYGQASVDAATFGELRALVERARAAAA